MLLMLCLAGVGSMSATGAVAEVSIDLQWDPATGDPRIKGYEIHYGLVSGNYSDRILASANGAATNNGTVPALESGNTYYFAVRARNADGSMVSAFSNETSVTILSSGTSSDCSGTTITIADTPFPSGETTCNATASINTQGNVVVSGTSLVAFNAPVIALSPGFRVHTGGVFNAYSTSGAAPRRLNNQRQVAAATAEAPIGFEADSQTQTGHSSSKAFSYKDFRARLAELGASVPYYSFNDEGTAVVFATSAALVDTDTNGQSDVYLYDVLYEAFVLVSRNALGKSGRGPSLRPRIDANGERVVFESDATDLIENEQNGVTDVYIYDWVLDQIDRASVTETGGESSHSAHHPVIGGEGRWVLFEREDAIGLRQIYGYDADAGYLEPEPFSFPVDEAGNRLDNHHPAISRDGNYIAYIESLPASDVVPGTCFVHLYSVPDDRYGLTPCPRGVDANSEVTLAFEDDDQWVSVRVAANGAGPGDPQVQYLPNAVWTQPSR